jgi:N-acetylglutamate synthase-like GNAT family acetyltransferase
VNVRPATADDAPQVAALAGELGYPASDKSMAQRIADVASRPDHALFVAEDGGRCAGWIHVCVVPSLESEDFGEIRGLIVTESMRGTGVGTALVAAAEAWALEHSCRRLRVRTNIKRLQTHAFYARRGFAMVKEQKVFDKVLR